MELKAGIGPEIGAAGALRLECQRKAGSDSAGQTGLDSSKLQKQDRKRRKEDGELQEQGQGLGMAVQHRQIGRARMERCWAADDSGG